MAEAMAPTVADMGTVGVINAPGSPIVPVAGGPAERVGVTDPKTGGVRVIVACAGSDGVSVGKTTT